MTLGSRFVGGFLVVEVVVSLVVLLGSSYFVSDKTLTLENRDLSRYTDHLTEEINDEQTELTKIVKDYAYWDDTYTFIVNKNTRYIESNINQLNLGETLGFDFVYFINSKGLVVASWESDNLPQVASEQGILSLDKQLSTIIGTARFLENMDGFIYLPHGLALISAKSILPSMRDKPSNGVLIGGIYVNENRLRRLSASLKTPVSYIKHAQFVQNKATLVERTSSVLQAYYPIDDVFGNHLGAFKLTVDRSIYQDSKVMLYSMDLFSVVVFTVSVAFILLMSRSMLSELLYRISYLSSKASNSVDCRFDEPLYRAEWEKKNDELGELAEAMEAMRKSAYDATHALQTIVDEKTNALEKKLAKEEKNSEAMIWLLDREKQHAKEFEDKEKELQDITKELYKVNLNLDEANRIKNEFVNIATHQLKNPLAALGGFIRLIQEGMYGKIPKKFEEPLSQIFICTDQIIALVEDMLKISRSEQADQVMKTETINLSTLILTEIRPVLEPLAKQKGLVCDYKSPKSAPIVLADKSKLKDILNNLIQNAIKYSDKGSVRVRHEIRETEVITSVSDDGIGIDPKEIKNMFKRFYRTKQVVSKGIPGTGLGLYIVKEYVEKMGGKVWVESTVGKGSTFTFSLPKAV